jgi:hypothetical protein
MIDFANCVSFVVAYCHLHNYGIYYSSEPLLLLPSPRGSVRYAKHITKPEPWHECCPVTKIGRRNSQEHAKVN